jgi:hypothetical protein
MVNAIGFPNTFVREDELKRLVACFPKIILYQVMDDGVTDAMKQEIEKGKLELRFPFLELHSGLALMWKEFEAWSKIHKIPKDLKTHFFSGIGHLPFFGESAPSRIASELKRSERGEEVGTSSHPHFQAGLFLTAAHRYDQYLWESERDLNRCEAIEKKLFSEMSGEEKEDLSFQINERPLQKEDWGGNLIPERIASWSELFLKDAGSLEPQIPYIFVTASPSALEYILDNDENWEHMLENIAIPGETASLQTVSGYRNALAEKILLLSADKKADRRNSISMPEALSEYSSGVLNLYRIKMNPREVFIRFVQHKKESSLQQVTRNKGPECTIIALLKGN